MTDGEYLVNKNKISIGNKNVSNEEISSYIKQKPNRRILVFFRFHLGIYNIAHSGKEHKLLKWLGVYKMGDIIGEPPVILDTLLTNKSVKQVKLFLNSKGYFNSDVNKEIDYNKKKAAINYIISTSEPYYIRNINYHIDDPVLKNRIVNDTANSNIRKGAVFDADILQNERERITTKLKNDGYFFFTKEYIGYEVDSAFRQHKLDITLEVRKPVMKLEDYPDSVVTTDHKVYTLNNILIYPNYSSLNLDTSNYKKYPYWALPRKKTAAPSLYTFVYKDTLRIKPKTITQSVFFKQGNDYKLKDVDDTYNSLMDLKIFKFVNIQFFEAADSSGKNNDKLDCKILLTRTPIQSVSVEAEATNSAGNIGVAGNLVYQNKNIFRGAEIFKFKIRGATEVQKVLYGADESGIEQIIPNTVETGADAGLDIPKFFLFPVKQERFSKYFMPKTNINAGLNYQHRPDYTRYIINFTFGWSWKPSKYQRIMIYPADVNSVKIYPTDAFLNTINSINDPKIKNSYIDHMITGGKASFLFSNQQIEKTRSFSYFKANADWSGNLLWWKNRLFKNYQNADGSYEVFNIKYSQYARLDADYRHYFVFDQFNTLVLRFFGGLGKAYKNSTVLPFEKSFYSGGANSMRAWKIYTLGPGAYFDTSEAQLNKTGDISLLGNLEYRFPVYDFLKSAFFIDAGNIWLNKKNDNMEDAEFHFSKFYRQIAVGSGLGLRFDFDFFILRLDFGIKVIDPAKPEGQQWVFKYIKPKDFTINFGIGYPF